MKFPTISFVSLFCMVCTIGYVCAKEYPKYKRELGGDHLNIVSNVMDGLTTFLHPRDLGWIDKHLGFLKKQNGTECDKCKASVRYAHDLLNSEPEKQHLISITMFKYCTYINKGNEGKCDGYDYFVTTQTKVDEESSQSPFSGLNATTSINFFDNDFSKVLKLFNVSSELDLEYFCAFHGTLGKTSCEPPVSQDVNRFFDLNSKWPPKQPKHYHEPEYKSKTRDRFNVLHLSDFHIQTRYKIGSESNCTNVGVCCVPESYNSKFNPSSYRFTDGVKKVVPNWNKEDGNFSFYPSSHYDENDNYIKGEYYDYPFYRGYDEVFLPTTTWGGYMCDAPEVMLNNSMKVIADTQKDKNFEFAIFTGDLVDHDALHADADTTKISEAKCFNIMKHYLGDIEVYPSLGNHDAFPYAQLPPHKYESSDTFNWNNEYVSDLWVSNGWFPKNISKELKSHYTGYAVTNKKGLKIIALNSNTYYIQNLWNYLNHVEDPDQHGQWQFLIDELVESESKGQRVWIMAHVPIGGDNALPVSSKIFARIVERFSPYTIANLFFGHTHEDQFHVLYSKQTSNLTKSEDIEKSLAVAWIVQSITPLTYYNPSWRYYEVENESFNIMNSYNYYTQLNNTFVNNGSEPEWEPEYSARKTYDSEGNWPDNAPLNATFWDKCVASKLKDTGDIKTNQLYADIRYRLSPYVPDCKDGDKVSKECYINNWCDVGSFDTDTYLSCKKNAKG